MNDYHRAPAVRYPTERPRTVAGALALVGALSGALGLWWWRQQGQLPAQGGSMALLWLLCSAAAWRAWRQLPLGSLACDGVQWSFLSPASHSQAPQQSHALDWPQIRWDGQSFLLLSAAGDAGGRHWLWLQRSSAPQLWSALRRALHARPGLAVSGAGGAPT
ncbi:hypothetical protein GCM10022279_13980 [Comamonas faecalis]|uniref:Toxin CptA n=1 Tax=Comamonas faecalis TaxID=1387849 RepID=A0ABP7R495_9BURK